MKKNCFFSEQITIAVGYELANDLSLLGTLYIQYPEGTCRTQTARGSSKVNLGYYVLKFSQQNKLILSVSLHVYNNKLKNDVVYQAI